MNLEDYQEIIECNEKIEKRVLILTSITSVSKELLNCLFDKNIRIEFVLKKKNVFLRAIRNFHRRIDFPDYYIWYDDWKNSISEFNTIIVFDGAGNNYLEAWLRKQNQTARIIWWHWNPVYNQKFCEYTNVEHWSFDKEDCMKYGFQYNSTFYSSKMFNKSKKTNTLIEYDIFFIGASKTRKEYLLKLETMFRENGFKVYFHVVESNLWKRVKSNKKFLPYEKVLNYVHKSKALLDIYQKGQIGLSIRVMEALFFQKKLITDNQDIINYDFYCVENIFILGVDPIEELENFINSEYTELSSDILNLYDVNSWYTRFFNNKIENISV